MFDSSDSDDSLADASEGSVFPSTGPVRGSATPDVSPTPSLSDVPTFIPPGAAPGDPPTFPADAANFLHGLGLGVSLTPPAAPIPENPPHLRGFEILEQLGQGGMGIVYRAVDERLNRVVAVKMMHVTHATPLDLARFKAEAVAVAAIRHPNVVQVFGFSRRQAETYYVMEYLANGSLSQRLKQGRLPADQAVALVAKLAAGAQAAHNANLVHRDIKPGNVLFDEHQIPKLTDFGLAKHGSSTLTHTEAMMGTPAYMAPEQAEGRAKFVGPAADIYALGVILYECLTGQRPFDHEDRWALLRIVQHEPPPPPSRFVPGIARDLELICLKCLAKNPADRYPSAEALVDDLERYQRGEAVSVRPPSVFLRTYRWAHRDPKAAGLLALGVMAMIMAIIGWNRHESRLAIEKALLAASERRHQEELQEELQARQAAEELVQAKSRNAEALARAKDEAERGRVIADKLTQNHSLLALLDRTRRWSQSRRNGWTWAVAQQYEKVDALPLADPIVIRNVRSVLADVALYADFQLSRVVSSNMIPGAIATSSTGPWLAVAEKRPISLLTMGVIQIIDTTNGRLTRELKYPPGFVRRNSLLDLDSVQHIQFSHNGLHLFAGTVSGRIFRFNLGRAESTPDLSWSTQGGAISQMVISADDRRVYLFTSRDHALKVFEQDGTPVPLPEGKLQISGLAVQPVNGQLYVPIATELRRLESTTLQSEPGVMARLRSNLQNLCFSRDGRFLLGSTGSTAMIVDAESLAVKGEFLDPLLRRSSHEDRVATLKLSPSGQFLATACEANDRTLKVWQVGTERLVGSVVIPGTRPIQLAWSSDERFLYATSANETLSFEVRPSPVQTLVGEQSEAIDRAAFTARGEGYATLSLRMPVPLAPLSFVTRGWFDTLCPREQVTVTSHSWLNGMSLAVRPGLSEVLIGSRTSLGLWKPDGNFLTTPLANGALKQITFDADGKSIWAVKDKTTVAVWDCDSIASPPHRIWNATPAKSRRGPFSLDCLTVGRDHAVVGASDGAIHLLNARTMEIQTTLSHSGEAVTSAAIRSDNKLAVIGTQNGSVSIIDLETGMETANLAPHSDAVTSVAFSHDGRYLVAGSKARTLRLWMRKGSQYEQVVVIESLPAGVRDLRFSPVDDRLMVVLDQERVVRLWDIAGLREQLALSRLGW